VPTLKGAGKILDVRIVGRQIRVTASNGRYVSQDGFIYKKVG